MRSHPDKEATQSKRHFSPLVLGVYISTVLQQKLYDAHSVVASSQVQRCRLHVQHGRETDRELLCEHDFIPMVIAMVTKLATLILQNGKEVKRVNLPELDGSRKPSSKVGVPNYKDKLESTRRALARAHSSTKLISLWFVSHR